MSISSRFLGISSRFIGIGLVKICVVAYIGLDKISGMPDSENGNVVTVRVRAPPLRLSVEEDRGAGDGRPAGGAEEEASSELTGLGRGRHIFLAVSVVLR